MANCNLNSPTLHHKYFATTSKVEHRKGQPPFCCLEGSFKTIKMPKKGKKDKDKDEIPFHNQYDYSDTLLEFSENDKLKKSDLSS